MIEYVRTMFQKGFADILKTPASRRFLSLSGASRSQILSSATRKGQFTRPSQPSSSSPFLRTPLQDQAKPKDDIETSFDDEEDEIASPLLNTRPASSTFIHSKGRDGIEDDEANVNATATRGDYRSVPRHTPPNNDHQDEEEVDRSYNLGSPRADFSSPLPKRQKISHQPAPMTEPIEVSSSPSTARSASPESVDGQDNAGLASVDLYNKEQDFMEDIKDEETTSTRFRIPRPETADSRNDNDRPSVRNAFKGHALHAAPWVETPLPATFSPSKRKGKQDYLYRGAAETVRSWILDIANEQNNEAGDVKITHSITTRSTDSSGRFHLVEDENKDTWLLVNQDNQQKRFSHKTANSREKEFRVKGTGRSWLASVGDSDKGTQSSHSIHVAVLWDAV